jgi:integrase/recombinase XerD
VPADAIALPATVNDLDPAVLAAHTFLARYKAKTAYQYRIDLRQWFTWCADHHLHPLRDVRRPHVELYARHLEQRFAVTTAGRRLSTVCGYYRYAVIDEHIDRDPACYCRRPKQPEDSQTLGLSHLQFEAVLVASRARVDDHALIALLGLCGLRVHEAYGLDVTSLSFEHGHRTIRFVGKGSKPAVMPLPPMVARALEGAVRGRDVGPLLLGRDGQRLNQQACSRIVTRVAAKAGVRFRLTPHGLRHTYVTTMLDAGVPLRDVQIAARHADPRTTTRYDRARQSLDRHGNYVLSAFMAGAA